MQPDLVEAPLHWSTPRVIFVNSMNDLLHDDLSDGYIEAIFDTIKRADHHVFRFFPQMTMSESISGGAWQSFRRGLLGGNMRAKD